MTSNKKELKKLLTGLGFLAPNILGFLCFTTIPLVLSMVLAFSNWDLKLHNMFSSEPIHFAGIDNFIRLFQGPDFVRYFGNTLFLMMGIPFAIGGSLCAALLLSQELRGKTRREWKILFVGALAVCSSVLLVALGMGATAMTLVFCSLGSLFLLGGVMGGNSIYRTLFYLPNFTSGVAVYLLWKKLYNPQTGPINTFLAGPLNHLTAAVNSLPSNLVQGGFWLGLALMALIYFLTSRRLGQLWADGELGLGAVILGTFFLTIPVALDFTWAADAKGPWLYALVAAAALVLQVVRLSRGREFTCSFGGGLDTGLMLSMAAMIVQLIVLGLSNVAFFLPTWASAESGLLPPNWLTDYYWAKPAIMIMGLWSAIGSNNMLLYLAGLSNVPQDLYDAADIDGASSIQRFWHITWPQLAPVTFFIVVMSMIGGLQGGFEVARTMTKGGPAGATTTLAYYIYTEGFETGRLGFASAVAWALFGMVFSVTMFNWKFGSRYVND